ncbi:MAG: hypothetical protein ABIH49_01390 [archaeon]
MKMEKNISRSLFLVFAVALVVVLSASFVLGANTATLAFPAASANISGSSYVLSATLDSNTWAFTNATFWYMYIDNGTNVTIGTNVTTSAAAATVFNLTWDTTAVIDASNYTIWVNLTNTTGVGINDNTTLTSSSNITLDNTAPTIAVYSGGTAVAYANGTIKTTTTASNNLTLNISITEATGGLNATGSTSFCFININGGSNYTVPINGSGAPVPINGSGFPGASVFWCNTNQINLSQLSSLSGDGANYTINIYVNDSLGNMRLNSSLAITLDTTAPTATAACSPSTVQTGDSFPCTCSTSDATSRLNASSNGATSSTSPDGVGTPSNTGTFTFTCSAVDNAGFTADATATYTVNQIAGSGSSPSGGGSGTGTVSWVTHTVSEDVLEQGHTRQLAASNRVQFTFGGESHHVGVVSVSTDKVTIEIASDPVQVSLAPGEDAKVDLDDDGYYDVHVTLNEIVGSNADVTIVEIHELIPEGEGAVGTTGQIEEGEEETAVAGGSSTWWWIGIAIVLLLVAVGYGMKRRS